MFAGSCIGVICLVIVLEFLRRLQREFDKFIALNSIPSVEASAEDENVGKKADSSSEERSPESSSPLAEGGRMRTTLLQERLASGNLMRAGKPTLLQQATRATIHTLQFAVAYFIMLLAMYYNGESVLSLGHFSRDALDHY